MKATRTARPFRTYRAVSRVTDSSTDSRMASPKGLGNCTRGSRSARSLPDSSLGISGPSLAAPQQRDPGTDRHNLAAVDPRLARLCAAWASLPEHVILAILALVDSGRRSRGRSPPTPVPRSPRARAAAGRPSDCQGRTASLRSPPDYRVSWQVVPANIIRAIIGHPSGRVATPIWPAFCWLRCRVPYWRLPGEPWGPPRVPARTHGRRPWRACGPALAPQQRGGSRSQSMVEGCTPHSSRSVGDSGPLTQSWRPCFAVAGRRPRPLPGPSASCGRNPRACGRPRRSTPSGDSPPAVVPVEIFVEPHQARPVRVTGEPPLRTLAWADSRRGGPVSVSPRSKNRERLPGYLAGRRPRVAVVDETFGARLAATLVGAVRLRSSAPPHRISRNSQRHRLGLMG